MSSSIGLVIVPASFTPSSVYSTFEDALRQHTSIPSTTVSLPSVGLRTSGSKPGSILDDAAEIARVVNDFYASTGVKEVVLLAHSYGGIPASESMKMISSKNTQPMDNPGVSRIVYTAGIVLPVGVSNDEMRKRPVPDYVLVEDDWITIDHTRDAPYAYNDLSREEGLALAAKMQQQSTASFREKATYPGYDDVEVHYIRCMRDETLPLEGTKRILGVIEESSGRASTVHEFDAGHCPMFSQPEQFARFVAEILGSS